MLSKVIPSPIGEIILASDGENLTGLWFAGQKHLPKEDLVPADLPIFDSAEHWLCRYFAGQNPDPQELPLKPAGSEFQQKVWELLTRIPYGEVTTYGAIAKALNCRSAQAVGGAVGRNPISIVIPCHRVVGSDQSMTGYAGGIDKKEALLKLEGYIK